MKTIEIFVRMLAIWVLVMAAIGMAVFSYFSSKLYFSEHSES
jgi:hypothetical protein